MMRLKNKFSIIVSIILLSILTCQAQSKPNIILINIGDMGWKDVSFMGSKYYETPNIDALASEGMIFTNAYTAASNCAPSRACMLSGEHTPRHGVYTVNNSDRGKSQTRKLIPIKNNEVIKTR